jgi:hypothetical protein
MQWSAILTVLGFALTTPAFAQDAVANAKKACEKFNMAGATGDAAKFTKTVYAEKAVMMGPGIAGMLVGRAAIEKYYTEAFKTTKAISNDCENSNFRALSDTTVLVSGTWTGTPADPNGTTLKGSFGITLVKDGDEWLAEMDSWTID